jgi:radical SAM-linked protein
MQANYVQRLRLQFAKTGPTRYIGHLDLARTLERALNRAGIPLAYTQGFNKRPRMQLGPPLPLGFTSEGEMVDIWLEEKLDPGEAMARIVARMAPGIVVHDVAEVPLADPSLQAQTETATYEATLLEEIDGESLHELVEELMAKRELPRERRGKQYDLRPQILALSVHEDDGGRARLDMTLTLLPGQTGRPDEVLEALGIESRLARIHRKRIGLKLRQPRES